MSVVNCIWETLVKKLEWFPPGYPDYPSNCNAIQGRAENSQHVNIVPTAG